MIFGGIVAGGTGSRMGADVPKQFLMLGDKPILIHTLLQFTSIPSFHALVIGVHKDWVSHTEELVREYGPFSMPVLVTPGGENRNDTILNMIACLRKQCGAGDGDCFVTHDAVRPFVSTSIIEEHIRRAGDGPVLGTTIPATDTIVVSEDGTKMTAIPNRATMYQAQTPQTFPIGRFEQVYSTMTQEEKDVASDACGIFLKRGLPVEMIRGEEKNRKLTHPLDLDFARSLLENELSGKDLC